jgi:general stress protein YciG
MKDPAAVKLGAKGGKARAKALTPEQRKESARKAGQASGRARRSRQKLPQ